MSYYNIPNLIQEARRGIQNFEIRGDYESLERSRRAIKSIFAEIAKMRNENRVVLKNNKTKK